ncbi:hypothetical protein PENSPDRAFT_654578 [Peniophora sp. CONT]|nr:hypothetical protein PENSPDRAFT_654578 [Peniophora sp. CONT]
MVRGLQLFALASVVLAQSNSTDDDNAYPSNPYLQYRPDFSRSLPTQILVTTVTLTLLGVLAVQLAFTAQYHWKLARTNFVLQAAALVALLAGSIASLMTIVDACIAQSKEWPYMLNYIAVDLPPLTLQTLKKQTWSTSSVIGWQLANALWGILIQMTHIQFLTLMYPSRLEASLIFILLGPLSLVAAVMQIATIKLDGSAERFAEAVRNVCNASLSLIFLLALVLWGFFVNRKQAWRTDGGTAAFGGGALFLALASCALTFVYIPSAEQYDWMPPLTGAVMLWQSFLGWWWWVGAGMGVGEVEDFLRREEKRRRRRQLRDEKRREQKEKARELWSNATSRLSARRRRRASSGTSEEIEDDSLPPSVIPVVATMSSSSNASSTGSTSTQQAPPTTITGRVLAMFRSSFAYIRHSHMTAAQARVREQAGRLADAYGSEEPANGVHGWGLGHYGVRESARLGRDVRNARSRRDVEDEVEDDQEEKERARRGAGSGMWWWEPLRRWRLQDSTTYS